MLEASLLGETLVVGSTWTFVAVSEFERTVAVLEAVTVVLCFIEVEDEE